MGLAPGLSDPGMAALLVELLIKGALILLAAELLTGLLRRQSAALRHLVWTAAIASVLVLPLAGSVMPPLPVPLLQSPARVAGQTAGSEPATSLPAQPSEAQESTPRARALAAAGATPGASPRSSSGISGADVVRWLGVIWAVGAVAIVLRLAVGTVGARRLAATAAVAGSNWQDLGQRAGARLGLRRRAELLISERTDVPMAWGILHPVVVLPAEAAQWDHERRRLVLVHELAHVKRRDCLTQLAAHAACAVYWMNPLTWRAAARLRSEREMACDDLVITSGTRGSEYAKHLLEIAQQARGFHPAYGVSLPMARPSQLEGRLLSILNAGDARRDLTRHATLVVPVVALALLLPIAAVQPWAIAAPEPAELTGVAIAPAPEGVVAPLTPQQLEELAARLGERLGDTLADVTARELAEIVTPTLTRAATGTQEQPESPGEETRARVHAAMVEVLQSGDEEMRADAAHALGNMEDPAAVDALVAALGDSSADVRANAAWALGMIEHAAAVPGLLAVAQDADSQVRSQAVWALGMIESAAAVEGLAAFAYDDSEDVRANVAWALGMIESPAGVAAAASLLVDDIPAVRSQAAWALGMIESADGVPPLLNALADNVEDVRVQVVWALGMIEDSAAVDALITALQDDSAEVRRTSAWALGMIEDPAALDALLDAMKDSDRGVQRAAMDAISMISG